MAWFEWLGVFGSVASIIGLFVSIYCYQHYYNRSINRYKKLCRKIDKGITTNDDIVVVKLALKDASYLEIVEVFNWIDKKRIKTELDAELLKWINHELENRKNK